jgi:hypothetical protein
MGKDQQRVRGSTNGELSGACSTSRHAHTCLRGEPGERLDWTAAPATANGAVAISGGVNAPGNAALPTRTEELCDDAQPTNTSSKPAACTGAK